jgi:hypothetical protein
MDQLSQCGYRRRYDCDSFYYDSKKVPSFPVLYTEACAQQKSIFSIVSSGATLVQSTETLICCACIHSYCYYSPISAGRIIDDRWLIHTVKAVPPSLYHRRFSPLPPSINYMPFVPFELTALIVNGLGTGCAFRGKQTSKHADGVH